MGILNFLKKGVKSNIAQAGLGYSTKKSAEYLGENVGRTVGSLATKAVVGGVAGAAIGGLHSQDGENVGKGAAIGAIAGMAALPMLGGAARVGKISAKKVGSLDWDGMARKTGKKAADMGERSTNFIGRKMRDFNYAEAGRKGYDTLSNIGSKFIKTDAGKIELTGLGKASVLGFSLYGMGKEAGSSIHQSKIGYNTGITRATPNYMDHQQQNQQFNNYGATGDLVFAMNQNRRG